MTTDDRRIAWWETEYREDDGSTSWWGGGMNPQGEYSARFAASTRYDATGRYRPVYAVPGEPRDVKEERNGD